MGKGSKRRKENAEAVRDNYPQAAPVWCSKCGENKNKLYYPGRVCEDCR